MNKYMKKALKGEVQVVPRLKAGLLPMLMGIAALSSAPVVLADNECGPGPTVTCTVENYSVTGITYNFSSDFDITTSDHRVGTNGLRLNGSGDADLRLNIGQIYGEGGIQIDLENGNLVADINFNVLDASFGTGPGGGGMRISTGGGATIQLRGETDPIQQVNRRITNLIMDVGGDSVVNVERRRTVQAMTLSPRAGATLTVRNEGALGADNLGQTVTDIVYIRGAGAGHLVLDNTGPRGRITSAMDFTGMTGQLTILNDHSGNPLEGGWHTTGTNSFGSGTVEIQNRRYGALRTAGTAVFDFSDTTDSLFRNEGRLMVGTAGIGGDSRVTFVGLDRFENSGLILLGTVFSSDLHQGLVSDGLVKDRLTFQDSHYVGVDGSRIALDVALSNIAQADCSTLVAADCVQFTGSSTTSGVTLLNVSDVDPRRAVAQFNAGITLVEGASAAEHFVLDPASQFYVSQTSGGAALQKGMVAYRLQYDEGTRRHLLVGTLADEGPQAATLGAAAHEAWRVSADTWFDRQAAARDEGRSGFGAQSLWFTTSMSRGDRSLQRTMDVAGTPSTYNLAQDQDVTHLAFGLDLLQGSGGGHSWSGGVTMGLLQSTVDYEATNTQTRMAGLTSGIYGSWALAGLSVDGMFNVNYLRQEVDGSRFALGQYNRIRTQVKSNGGRLEAAWKLPVGEGFWLQPLLGVSNVRTSEGDITLPDDAGGVRFGNDDRSIRFGGGLRVGVDSTLAGLRTQYRLTGRMWNERDAQNSILVDVGGEPQPVSITDDFGGNFNEVDGSLSVSNDAGSLSGYVGVKHRFSDDYSTIGGSAGIRYSW